MSVLTASDTRRNPDGPFSNPWPPVLTMFASAVALMRLPFARATPLQQDLHGVKTIKTVKPDFELLDSVEDLWATWLGHAVITFAATISVGLGSKYPCRGFLFSSPPNQDTVQFESS
jgi:hypothetical protein